MINLIASILAWIIILGLFGLSVCWDKSTYKNVKVINIVVVAMLCAIAVLLSNLLGYNFIFFGGWIKMDFGIFLIFIIGMLFGPFYGVIAGIAADTLGILINIGGTYSAIFTLDKVLYGFVGAIIFMQWNYKWWFISVPIVFLGTYGVVSLGLNNVYLWSLGFFKGQILSFLVLKLIKWPVATAIYSICIYFIFSFIYYFLQKRNIGLTLWCNRFNCIFKLLFHFKLHNDHSDDESAPTPVDPCPRGDELIEQNMQNVKMWI